jgi:hypothetical protein
MSSNAVAKSISRPPTELLRKPLQNYFKRHLIYAVVAGFVGAFAYKFAVYDTKKRSYKKFYTLVIREFN